MSCEKEADIKIPEVKPKLVISSFICPQDTIIRVLVTKTAPIFRTRKSGDYFKDFNPINDAIVTITDGQNSINLVFNEKDLMYTSQNNQYQIQPEVEYQLTVSALGQTVKAKCKIPKEVTSLIATVDSIEYTRNYWGEIHTYKVLQLTAKWTDIFPETNYYRLLADVETNYPSDPDFLGSKFISAYFEEETIRKDKSGSSGTMSLKGEFNSGIYTPPDKPERKAIGINVHLLHINEDYYKYYEWLRNDNDGNPFAEPTLVYTNVVGGLGVFAGYNRYSLRLDMPQ